MDVGLVIQNSILHGFEIGIQSFAHPHLIIELCHNAKVKWTSNEEVSASKGVIDDGVVMKIHDDDKVALQPVGVGSNS